MLYICEFTQTIPQELLLEQLGKLPLSRPEKELTELRWRTLRERILGWTLLFYGLEKEGYPKADTLRIERGTYGKPFFTDCPDIHFNISHCSFSCACGISRFPCGVDIERRFPYNEKLARKVSNKDEWVQFFSMSELQKKEERAGCLQKLWSLKECYVKRNGRGIGYGMKQINLLNEDLQDFAFFQNENYTFAALCKEEQKEIRWVTEDMLLAFIRKGCEL